MLAHAVVAINRARGQLRAEDPTAAIEAWKALVAGRWSLVDHVDSDGKRFLVARKNDPDHAGPTGLSRRERQILAARARGFSLKLIAYDLGLSIAGVSRGLQSGMTKLGVRHEGELAAFFSQPPAVAPHGRDRASLRHPFGHRSGALVKAGRNWSSVMKGSWWSFFAVPGGRVS